MNNGLTKSQKYYKNHKGDWKLENQIELLKLKDKEVINGLKKICDSINNELSDLSMKEFELKEKLSLIQKGCEGLTRQGNYDSLKKYYKTLEDERKN